MRVGASLTTNLPAPDPATGAGWLVDRARVVHDAGLSTLSLGDHHSVAAPYYQNTPMLGRLLAEWTDDRPFGCLFLLPLWNPVLVAEHVGTLAAMASGPFVIQTGIGHGAAQFAAMGARLRTRGADTDEAIRIVKGLLGGDTVSSERFAIEDANIALVPRQPVEWWIGAGSAGPLARAAREGSAWYAGAGVTLDDMATLIPMYLDACERVGNDSPRVVMRNDVLVLDDGDRAAARADELIAAGYRGMRSREHVTAGGVEEATERFGRFAELGVDEIVVRCMNVTQPEALETLSLCGEINRRLA